MARQKAIPWHVAADKSDEASGQSENEASSAQSEEPEEGEDENETSVQ